MRVCATTGTPRGGFGKAAMREFRLDVFDALPAGPGKDDIITLAGRDVSKVPSGFGGLVDVGDSASEIPFRKIRSVHDFERTPSAGEIASILDSGDQEVSKMACAVHSFTDLHSIYEASQSVARKHVLLGMGELGTVTRIRQSVLGNEFTFGYVGKPTAPGQLSAEEMERLGDGCEIVGITGHPLKHSLSPQMQGAAMADKGINGIYLRFDSPDLAHVEDVVREYDIRGLNVTIPYKKDVVSHLDSVEGPAEAMGAVNTVINDKGKLVGTNTDYAGVLYAFERAGRPLKGCARVLVFGSGGAARAAVYAAKQSGCEVSVLGRTKSRVEELCDAMGAEPAREPSVRGYDAVINCTPIGMYEDSPYMFDLSELENKQAVMDMVYNRRTQLVAAAEAKGCTMASGRDMLVGQGALSFERWFGVKPDTDVMRRAVM